MNLDYKKTRQSAPAEEPTARPGRPKGSSTKYPGIIAAAASLGCGPAHLARVLDGERPSATIAGKLRKLKPQPLYKSLLDSKHTILNEKEVTHG